MKFCWLLVLLSVSGFAADWPQWRGPRRTGVSQETGLLKEWPKEGPKLLWQLPDVGDGYATPAVAGTRLYLLGNHGMENEFVQALSVRDGKTIWSTRLGNVGSPNQEPPYPMARSTPTIDGDVLYALSSDGDLACLETATGKVRWQKNVRAEFGGKPGKWAYAESPLIDGDVLVVSPGGAEATLVALNKKTGAVIWKSAVPGGDLAAYSSAIVVEAAGHKQYVQFLDKGVVGVDAKTGQFLWRYAKTSGGPANIPTPVEHDGYVYSANSRRFGGGLVQLHASGEGVTAEEVYFERDVPNTLGGQVLLDGYLYGTNPKGMVAAEFVTGKVKWQAPSVGPGAVQYADGRLYVHGENGDVALVEATPDAYREKGRFTPGGQPKRVRAREMAWAYPVVANGRLYIRDLGTLWCYDVKEATNAASRVEPQGPNPDMHYRLGPDSLEQEGTPKGEIRGPFHLPSAAYPGTSHTYFVYVPAQYNPSTPASLMVFNDGQAMMAPAGDARAQNVMDNLIYRREIPVMIGVFINPGRRPDQPEPTPGDWGDRNTNRPTEYNSLDDRYARVIVDELLPVLKKEYNISEDPERHGIGGASSGAIAAFTVAWERPNQFRKVLSIVGSFTNLRGGHVYPEMVRKSEKKPIRIFLQDGRNDNRGERRDGVYDESRDWFYQNVRLMQALTEKGYEVNYAWGIGKHGQKQGGAILPEMMRWLWRDQPVSTDPKNLVERSFNEPAAKPQAGKN